MGKPIPFIKINSTPLESTAFDMEDCSMTELIIPIEKALDTSKLVKKLVNVTHNGKTYQAMRWVRPNEAASQELQGPRNSEDYLLAPNGKPSNLNEKQWHQVRTPEFKKWFGDWELSEKKVLLTGPAIKKIKSGVIRGDENTKPIEAALKWAKKNIQESIDAAIGEIIINERGIKDSLSHGFSQKKLDSIQALPDVLKSGVLLGSIPDYKGDRIVNHFFAAPIELDNERNILFVRVRGSENGKHFYVHEIFLEREIKELETHQTIAESEDSRPHRGLKLYKNILQKIYAVNPNSVSKIVDENGEPLVVYKGMMKNDWRTGKEIESIDSPNGQWAGFFTDRKDVAEKFQRVFSTMGEAVLHSVYLSIQNPYVYDANGALARDVMFDDVVFGKNPTNPDALAAFNKEYDGVIIKNTADEGTIYVPKTPNQIKSINAMEFDPRSPNFSKSLTFSGRKLQGRKKVQGMDISIENKKDSYRCGKDKDGHAWKTLMHADYGYIRGTVGKDKDHLDCYVGPNPQSKKVFIIHQNDPTTGKYDEDKTMLGFDTPAEAKALYTKQYDRPGFFGSMDETDIDTFKAKAFADSAKGKKLVIKKSEAAAIESASEVIDSETIEFYQKFYNMMQGKDGHLDVYGNRYKLKDLEGFPKGLDLENCDIISIEAPVITFQAGGDWQHGVYFGVGLSKDGGLKVVSLYEERCRQSKDEIRTKIKVIERCCGILPKPVVKAIGNPRLGTKFYTEESLRAENPKAKEIIGGLRALSLQLEDEIERKYPKELEVGIRVEKEHTDDLKTAKIIAMAHIKERPDYYTKLIAAGLVDEPEAIKMAKKIGIAKALPKAGDVENSHQSPPKGYPKEKKEYADPNNYKYPLDTEEHVRAAIAYFSKPSNYSVYPVSVRRSIWNRIMRAAREYGIVISDQDKFKKSNILFVSPLRQRAERVRGVVVRVLQKAKKSSRLVPVKKNVVRDGRTYSATYWILPEQVSEFQHGNNIEGRKPISVQLDLFDQPPAEEPEVRDKQIAQAINMATPETRARVAEFIAKADIAEETPMPKEEEYRFMPSERNVGTIGNLVVGTIKDYTGVVPKRIFLVPKNKILYVEKPSWVPEVDERFFEQQKGRLPFVKTGNNEYLVQLADQDKPENERYAIVNLDVLVATNDFYLKKVRAAQDIKIKAEQELRKMRVEEELHRLQEKFRNGEVPEDKRRIWQHDIEYYQKILSGKIKIKSSIKPLRLMGDKKMTYTQMGLLVDVNNGVRSRDKTWGVYGSNLREYNQKLSDMEIQQEDLLSSYVKGRETSYGDKKTRKDLLDKYGVLVKRQNGSDITQEEIGAIKDALDSVFAVYGDRSSMARRFGLKISHSGEKLMHARNALGVFIPYYRAIGVTARLGDKHMGFTLSHEWAHFMDHYLGGDKFHFSSDEIGSLSNVIADRFRNNMQKRQTSDYQQRTCECFARAFEEYFSIKTGDSDTLLAGSSKEGNYVEPEFFKKDIAPLIESFFEQNSSMLKAMKVSIRNLK